MKIGYWQSATYIWGVELECDPPPLIPTPTPVPYMMPQDIKAYRNYVCDNNFKTSWSFMRFCFRHFCIDFSPVVLVTVILYYKHNTSINSSRNRSYYVIWDFYVA